MMRESCETSSVEVQCHRAIGGAEDVDPHVEFFPAHEEWVRDVALGDVGLGLGIVRLPP
jgi:hypothetical protein